MASDIGGHRELIRDGYTGLLFPADNVSALAETLRRLLDETGLRQALGRQGAKWVCEERSWDHTITGYVDVYSRLSQLSQFRRVSV